MLTSMLKRVDVAAYNVFKGAMDGTWKSGIQVLGLKEGGIDWALDEHNKHLITPAMKAAVEQAKTDIIAGNEGHLLGRHDAPLGRRLSDRSSHGDDACNEG